MPAILQSEPERQDASFEEHVQRVAEALRQAIAQMLASAGADAAQPRAVAKSFGLDKTLAWKLCKIVSEDSVAILVDHLPGRAGFDIAMRTFEEAGASPRLIKALQAALAEFDAMVESHCGDRETLELMLGYLHKHEEPQREELHRKRAFQGNRAIWGVQARLQVCMHFIAPNLHDPATLDTSTVSGLVDLRRLRTDTVWPAASFRHYSDDGSPLPPQAWEPIDRNAYDGEGPPVLREFSSEPLPPMRSTSLPSGMKVFEITEGPVGARAAITCLTGVIHRGRFSRYRDERDRYGELMVTLSTPVEGVLHEMYVHNSLRRPVAPEYGVYSQLPNEPVYPAGGRDRGRLRISEPLIELGNLPGEIVTPEYPQLHALTTLVVHRLGWTARDFHGYRFRMRYPPMSARAVFRYELPERP